jgi:hypothetical protein
MQRQAGHIVYRQVLLFWMIRDVFPDDVYHLLVRIPNGRAKDLSTLNYAMKVFSLMNAVR